MRVKPAPGHLLTFAAAAALCGICVWGVIDRLGIGETFCGVDDANIFFVYAKNLCQGRGLVFNSTDPQPVEGFTSLLWVVIAAAVFCLSKSPEYMLLAVNILLTSLALTAVTVHIDTALQKDERYRPLSFPGLLFLVLALASPRYIGWVAVSLMDTGIWSALLAGSALLLLRLAAARQRIAISIVVFLLLLARPEAMLWCPLLIALGWFKLVRLQGRREALRFLPLPLTVYCATLACLTAFRIHYFGYALPNTYYAKVSPDLLYNLVEGVKYFARYALVSSPCASLAVCCWAAQTFFIARDLLKAPRGGPDAPATAVWLNGFCITVLLWCGFFIPIISGGDHFGSHRFYQPIHPLLMLNVMYVGYRLRSCAGRFSARRGTAGALLACGLLLAAPVVAQSGLWLHFGQRSGIREEFEIARGQRSVGGVLSKLFAPLPAYPTVGAVVVGGLKFAYRGPVCDLMGLNNIAMGHSGGDRKGLKNHAAFDKEVFFRLQPELVNPAVDTMDRTPFRYDPRAESRSWINRQPLKKLYDEPRFKELYHYARISRRAPGRQGAARGFCHTAFTSRISRNPLYRVEIAAALPEAAMQPRPDALHGRAETRARD